MAFAVVIGALILLVVLHELGHFLAARLVGIRATKFYVFFPPALVKRRVGDVEWGIGSIPAGGFVKLPGMFTPTVGHVAQRVGWELDGVRSQVGPDVQLQIEALRRTLAAADAIDDIEAPLTELIALLATLDTDEAARARTRLSGMLDDLHPRAYWRAALWRRMVVIVAGPLVNVLLAFVILVAFHAALEPTWRVTSPLRIDSVASGSPASRAGLDERSRIIEWDGPVAGSDPRELIERISSGIGSPVQMTWLEPDGTTRRARIVPEAMGPDGDRRIGINPAIVGSSRALKVERSGRVHRGVVQSTKRALDDMWQITWGNLTRLPRVFFDQDVRNEVGSVVGIVDVADEVDRAGQSVWFIAVISLILGVMNLLPLLPLDGGHLLFGVIEAIRRRPMPRAAFERYSMVGLAIVLVLFVIGLDNDIGRITK